MNNEPPPVPGDGLQFDKAEFAQANALSCAFCKAPITGEYFQINNQVSCPNCRQQLETHLSKSSKASRTLIASAAGLAAAIAGCLVYWGIRATTGYEIGLVAILVGWMVGAAVRWGSQHRGGLFYQLMAVLLTYVAMATTYMPDIIQGLKQGREEEAVAQATQISTNTTATTTTPKDTTPQENSEMPFVFIVIFAFIISLAAPFLMGLDNIIGILILGFGLYQAWIMNRKSKMEVTGPYSVARPA